MMAYFLRLLGDKDKERSLVDLVSRVRAGGSSSALFEVAPESFEAVPGKPFSYWVTERVRDIFKRLPSYESEDREVRQGLATADDFRFVRCWWETWHGPSVEAWPPFAKGGSFSRFYTEIYSCVNWSCGGEEIKNFYDPGSFKLRSRPQNTSYYTRPGITWPLRGIMFSAQAVPEGSVFSIAGKMAFSRHVELPVWLAIFNSSAFDYLVRIFAGKVGGVQYESGLIGRIPVKIPDEDVKTLLADLARTGWLAKRSSQYVNENSHAFILPRLLVGNRGGFSAWGNEEIVEKVKRRIDELVFELYDFSEEDRQSALAANEAEIGVDEESDEVEIIEESSPLDELISWSVGVAFGRFDWRLATGERAAPPEPEPFDPLPAKSPGMLPDGAAPYHRHAGILVDDPGHKHDLPRLMADVLETVDAQVDEDLRRRLRRDFFKYHLQQYSKSRRKAPIYWPLATASGNYTLWLYYPDLTDQTLFTAVNDFVEPKLKQVDSELGNLRLAGASRSRADEKRLEELSEFRDELADLRDTLLKVAPGYKPNHDDGVQITAAPLWLLFRHNPWQKVLKETWEKLKQGDYDWAHLAMAYWPDRVRERCVTDKSLAIAHDLEHLYVEPEPARGGKNTSRGGD